MQFNRDNKEIISNTAEDKEKYIKGVLKELDNDKKFQVDDASQLYNYIIAGVGHLNLSSGEYEYCIDLLKENLNLILYGPPGTGKTYTARQIVIENESKKKPRSEKEKGIIFNKLIEGGRVEFITFHQSFSYEEFVEGIRPTLKKESNKKESDSTYEISDGVLKRIVKEAEAKEAEAKEAKEAAEEAMKAAEKAKKSAENLEKAANKAKEAAENAKKAAENLEKAAENAKEAKKSAKNAKKAAKNLEKAAKNAEKAMKSKKAAEETKKAAENLEKAAENLKNTTEIVEETRRNLNYYLIIDELNAGDPAKIFGELFTLIERDKRETYKVTLPYSGEKFSIPNNLYIIATMNTADRTSTVLDTALRRRFFFYELEPDSNLIKDNLSEDDSNIDNTINLGDILNKLNTHITEKIDRDHRIGHAYFIKIRYIKYLETVWYQQIIPLLMDYFYNDNDKIKEIIGGEFFSDKEGGEIIRLKGDEFIKALKSITSNENNNGRKKSQAKKKKNKNTSK